MWMVTRACSSAERWLDRVSSHEVLVACRRNTGRMTGLRELEARAAIRLGLKLVLLDIKILGTNGDGDENEKGRFARVRYRSEYEKLLLRVSKYAWNQKETSEKDCKHSAS